MIWLKPNCRASALHMEDTGYHVEFESHILHMDKLIQVLKETFPDTDNGAIFIHYEKDTKNIKSLSPMIKAESVVEVLATLAGVRDNLQLMIDDITDKSLKDKGQGN